MKSRAYRRFATATIASTAILTLGIVPCAVAQEQPRKSEPAPISLTPSVDHPLLQPFQSLGSQGSMSGVLFMTQPATVPMPDAATPSVPMQGSGDWIFSDMNALFGSSKSGGSFGNAPSGTFGSSSGLSPVEQYYENLGKRNAASASPISQWMISAGQSAAAGKAFNPATAFSGNSSFWGGAFSSGDKEAPSVSDALTSPAMIKQNEAQQKRRDEFMKILDPRAAALTSTSDPMSALRGFSQPANAVGGPAVAVVAEPHQSALTPVLGMVDPTVAATRPQALVDPTERVLGPNTAAAAAAQPKKSLFDNTYGPQKRKF